MSSDVNLASTKDESPKPGLGEREGDVDSNNSYTGEHKDNITDTNTETTPQCTEHDCIDDEDQYKFECKKMPPFSALQNSLHTKSHFRDKRISKIHLY